MNWLITGGCGFIGRNLIHFLLQQEGHAVRVVDNLSVGSRENLEMVTTFDERAASKTANDFPAQGKVELVVDDILNEDNALDHAARADVIVHLAANTGVAPSVENPRHDCMTNVLGTFNYLEAARRNGECRFILASSGAPLGEVEPPIHEEKAPHPKSPYGASKLAGEGYCSAYHGSFDVDTVALRFGNVYGPFSSHKSSVVAKFIRRAMEGKTLEIYGDGKQTRDFIYTGDLVAAIYKAATKEDVGGEVFQIATNKETTVLELTESLTKELEKAGISDVDVAHTDPRTGDVRRNYSDTSKAAEILDWTVETTLESGLRKTIRWFVEE
ncbi:MAG: GDP-mannose 4,6-dehydratase [Fodinibius sp.]|nr:GDP-mannose 4,6-dehydratase [Fodinibius sp.]